MSRGRRLTMAAVLMGALAVVGATPAEATGPPAAGLPDTVPPIAKLTSKSVTADPLPTAQIDGVVWSQVILGNTVFAGGSFSTARPAGAAPGTATVPRSNLLAYSVTSGKLITTFAPQVYGEIRALALSYDKKALYLAGSFTAVDGQPRGHFAAVSVKTGKLLPLSANADNRIDAIAVSKKQIYLGGWFGTIGDKTRPFAASISPKSGTVLKWNPKPNAAVRALLVSPYAGRIVLGGGFDYVGTTRAKGMTQVTPVAAAIRTWRINKDIRNWGTKSAILSLAADKNTIYGTGYAYGGGNFEGTFAADPKFGDIKWLEDCHGDSYSVFPIGSIVYSVGHAHFCSNIGGFPDTNPRARWQHALAFTSTAKGRLAPNTQLGPHYGEFGGQPAPSMFNWFPTFTQGTYTGMSQAAWSVVGNSTYVALGGEFLAVNGTAQQGLVRFAVSAKAPNEQGPRFSGNDIAPTAAQDFSYPNQTRISISWPSNADRDDRDLSYAVLRNGTKIGQLTAVSLFWDRRTLSYLDTTASAGTSYQYEIVVSDPHHNAVTSPSVSIITSAAQATGPR